MTGSAESFLLAAKRAEIQSLLRLAETCRLVSSISDLIHDIQRERGLSNVYLASQGTRLNKARRLQISMSRKTEQQLRELLRRHFLEGQPQLHVTRVLSRIAFVVQALDDLEKIRAFIDKKELDAEKATLAYGRLIAGLLGIIFEAADSAGDPAISKALVALLNFMQGKEYAGQERAWAAIGLARGHIQADLKERLMDLKSAQDRTFSLFEQFAEKSQLGSRQDIEAQEFSNNLNSLRKVIHEINEKDTLSSEISEVWYDLATQRIDAMHALELQLCAHLLEVCQQRQETVERHLLEQENTLAKLTQNQASLVEQDSLMLLNMKTPVVGWSSGLSSTINNFSSENSSTAETAPEVLSLYDLLRDQATHLEQTRQELEQARRALSERKLVEKAKAMLMKSLNLSEDVAYRKIQQRAMDSNLRLGEVSEIIISTLDATLRKK